MKKLFTIFCGWALCGLSFAQEPAKTATFEELELPEPGYYIGAEQVGDKTFKSGDFLFTNTYTWWEEYSYGSWSGFGYANLTSTDYDATASYDRNSFTVPAGGGAEGSKTYAVAYGSSYTPASLALAEGVAAQSLQGAYFICNATQINGIENGDGYVSAFKKGDYAVVVVTGYLNGEQVGQIEVTLADYRFDNEAEFYYLKQWTWFDLSGLGQVDKVTFHTHCNQQDQWGEVFAQYICIDNFNCANPSAANRPVAVAPSVKLFPVPARESLTVSTEESNYTVEVFNLSGSRQMSVTGLSGNARLNTAGLTNGMYLLRMTTAKGAVSTQKFVVAR